VVIIETTAESGVVVGIYNCDMYHNLVYNKILFTFALAGSIDVDIQK